jgi:hypothetical protein
LQRNVEVINFDVLDFHWSFSLISLLKAVLFWSRRIAHL